MKRVVLACTAVLAGLVAAPSPIGAVPPPRRVTTTVTQDVEACGYGCCFSGRMKATFKVATLDSQTADVDVRFSPMGVGGSCGNISGAATTTTTVPIGTPSFVSAGTWYVSPMHVSVLSTFVVQQDASVANVSQGLYVFIIPPF